MLQAEQGAGAEQADAQGSADLGLPASLDPVSCKRMCRVLPA